MSTMTRSRIALVAAAAALVVTALLFGGVLRESSSASPIVVAPQLVESFQAGFSLGASAGDIALQLQETLRSNPSDQRSWVLLGLAYQQRARETGDPGYYGKSEKALRRGLSLTPDDALAISGLGSLALSRHRFREALVQGRRAVALARYTARHYGVVGDALIELGRHREAFAAFDRMNALRPSISSYARVSYGRELIGHTKAAISAMQLAVETAGNAPEPTAWTRVQLGKIYWSHGRLTDAAREYRSALAGFPGYAYALDALAQVEAARGRYVRAIALARRAVEAMPLPQYVANLGDLYRASGKPGLARQQYALIGAIARLLSANGVKTDLEIALFDVDHGIALGRALARTRQAHAERPSIDADDILAWALIRNGRCHEALTYSRRVLRLGTQDALKFFHRGMAERCLGHNAPARTWFRRALALNPHFSILWAPTARRFAA
jgi:tetratricopeptide (TPR) repeat protein